jgi:hypothetical protein
MGREQVALSLVCGVVLCDREDVEDDGDDVEFTPESGAEIGSLV